MLQDMAPAPGTPLTFDLPTNDNSLWDSLAELAEAVMTSGPPAGFVRRKLPVGGRRAHAYAGLASTAAGRPATLVVVIAPGHDPQANRRALRTQFGLTPREAEVALLLADRRSNREIAEALHIADKTARRHTERILSKLNAPSRRAVAAVVAGVQGAGEGSE